MKNPVTMFYEKREGRDEWSMTRVCVFMFAITYIVRLLVLSILGAALGWPDAFAIVAILFAIPFKDLFAGTAGASLLGKFLDRFGIGAAGTNVGADVVAKVFGFRHRFDPEK